LEERHVRVEVVPEAHGLVDLNAVLARLGRDRLLSVIVEGGAEVNRGVLENDLADKVFLFQSPKMLKEGLHWAGGALFDDTKVIEKNAYHFGEDTAAEFYIHNPYA